MQSISPLNKSFNLRCDFSYVLKGIHRSIDILYKKPLPIANMQKLNILLNAMDLFIRGIEKLLPVDKQNTDTLPEKACNAVPLDASPSVLLVEDAPIIQFTHQSYLTKMGFTVECAPNGTQAIQMFEQNNYALVLLDIGLPDISGIEVCRSMRANKKNIRIPIIVITGEDPEIVTNCLIAGANEVAFKPITLQELQKLLKKHITIPLEI
jgi:CheY-like chemotaxis protein